MKRFTLLLLVGCAVAAAQPICSQGTIRGTYILSYSGWFGLVPPGAPQGTAPTPMYGIIFGVASIGSDGALSGGATVAVAGFQPMDYVVAGTTEIGNDCTGKLLLKPYPKGHPEQATSETDRFVLDPETHSLMIVVISYSISNTPAVLGTWKRISPVPSVATW